MRARDEPLRAGRCRRRAPRRRPGRGGDAAGRARGVGRRRRPGVGEVESGDVIVEAEASDADHDALRMAVGSVRRATPSSWSSAGTASPSSGQFRTVPAPDDEVARDHRPAVTQDAKIRLLDVDIDLGDVGGLHEHCLRAADLPGARKRRRSWPPHRGDGRDPARRERHLRRGIKQKTYGVRRPDADVFLVPAGENAATAQPVCRACA